MSTNVESSSRMLKLRSSDNEIFEVKKEVLLESITLKNMILEEDWTEMVIPVPNVEGKILSKVIQYCRRHAEDPRKASGSEGAADSDEIKKFDSEIKKFDSELAAVDTETLFNLILAANYLNIEGLLDLTCQTVADLIKGMSVEQVRKVFNIKNDFTPEEEKAVREENKWAFED